MRTDLTKDDVRAYYEGVEYWPATQRLRPAEMHTVHYLKRGTADWTEAHWRQHRDARRLVVPLGAETLREYAALQLHESLFHYHKAFYNYLAARALYPGGMLHWVNITLYYAKFFAARAWTTLLGTQAYALRSDPPSLTGLLSVATAALDLKKKPFQLRVLAEIDLRLRTGHLQIDNERINSHQDVWEAYRRSPAELGPYHLVYPESVYDDNGPFGIPRDYLSQDRNEENYSFQGYAQLDFNLPFATFTQYFERDYVKRGAGTLYDDASGEVLVWLATFFNFMKSLEVPNLPLTAEKLHHMVGYCLPASKGRERLLSLLSNGFDLESLSSTDGDHWFDQAGRSL